jgi:hypothetical protein
VALLFFNRCEALNDAAQDLNSGGDSSWTASGSATFDAAANCGLGTNGMLFNASAEQFRKDTSTAIIDPAEGCIGFLWRPTNTNLGVIVTARGSTAANCYFFETRSTDEMSFGCGDVDGSPVRAQTTALNWTTNTVYGVIGRWNHATNTLRVEVYSDPLGTPTLIEGVSNTSGYTLPSDIAAADRLRFGDIGGVNPQFHVKNIFICDAYADAIESNFDITDYANFGGGGAAAAVNNRMLLGVG